MRTAILFSLLALAAATPAVAQETDDDRYRRLEAFVFGEGNRLSRQRLQQLTSAERSFMRNYAANVSSDYVRCQNGGADAAQACARNRARGRGPAARPTVVTPSAPAAPVMSAEQQDALAVWNELYPGLNSRRPDPDPRVWLRYSPAERTYMVEQCVRLRRAADILGPNYTRLQPCPPLSHFEGAAETVRRAEIAETQRIESARAAAARAAIANSGSGLVEVRTYDRNGNYTGTRMMTPSQAATVGARPQ